jgi:hypothetical protein
MVLESPIHRRFPKVWLLSTVVVTATAYAVPLLEAAPYPVYSP